MSNSGFSDDEVDRFYDVAAGRRDGLPGAQSLRDALLAEARTVREAENETVDQLSSAQRAQMDAIRLRLMQAGVFAPAAPSHQPSRTARTGSAPASLLAQWTRWALGDGWYRPVALAAALMLCTAVVWRMLPPVGDSESEVMRGGATTAIAVDDAAATARQLRERLVAAGAEVVSAPLSPSEWVLQVDVPEGADAGPVRRILTDAGVSLDGAPPFEVTVRQRQR